MLVEFSLAVFLSAHGYRKGSLSASGALGALLVGWQTFSSGPLFAAVLITFYACGSLATGVKWRVKQQLVQDDQGSGTDNQLPNTNLSRRHGNRNVWQVLSNALCPTIACAAHFWLVGETWPILSDRLSKTLFATFLGAYSCCMGDTLASELGILSQGNPILITSWKVVPRGTNGAVSLMGTAASFAGGMILALIVTAGFWLHDSFAPIPWWPSVVCVISAVGGMLLDSLFGATVQASFFDTRHGKVWNVLPKKRQRSFKQIAGRWDILSNNQVNAISSVITALLAGVIIWNKTQD